MENKKEKKPCPKEVIDQCCNGGCKENCVVIDWNRINNPKPKPQTFFEKLFKKK